MTNAAFAFMCAGGIALIGVCVTATGVWPLILSLLALVVAFVVYAKGW